VKMFIQQYLTMVHWNEEYSVLLGIDIGLYGRQYCCVSEVTNMATVREFKVITDEFRIFIYAISPSPKGNIIIIIIIFSNIFRVTRIKQFCLQYDTNL
jgi:hypothetical protein